MSETQLSAGVFSGASTGKFTIAEMTGEPVALGTEPVSLVRAALELADENACDTIESFCQAAGLSDGLWYDTTQIDRDCEESVRKALDYLRLRGDLCGLYTVRWHPVYKHLVRFEARP